MATLLPVMMQGTLSTMKVNSAPATTVPSIAAPTHAQYLAHQTNQLKVMICPPFLEFACNYGEFCCPVEGEGQCVPEKTCYCDDSTRKVSCYETTADCPSACPVTKPIDGSACDISERFYCQYATGTCSPDDLVTPDASCSCILGKYACTSNFCMGDSIQSVNEEPAILGGFGVGGVQNDGSLLEEQQLMPPDVVQESPSESPERIPQ
jgi:hypothetical protein